MREIDIILPFKPRLLKTYTTYSTEKLNYPPKVTQPVRRQNQIASLGCGTGSLQKMALGKHTFISCCGSMVWPQGWGLGHKQEHELQKAGQRPGPRQGTEERPGPRALLALVP